MDREHSVAVLRRTLLIRNIVRSDGAETPLMIFLCSDEGLLNVSSLYFDSDSLEFRSHRAACSELEWNSCLEVVLDDVQQYANVISLTFLLSGFDACVNFIQGVGFAKWMEWRGDDRRAHSSVLRSKVTEVICDPRRLVKANEELRKNACSMLNSGFSDETTEDTAPCALLSKRRLH